MGKVIWTKHLRERIKQRGLDPQWVDTAIRFPDEVQDSTTTNSRKHIKVINGYKIVAAVKRQGDDWVVTSSWWNPVYGKQQKETVKRSFPERLIYRFVVWLERLVLGKK
ncbi:MAG TPA: DUF4258 domain-containing protein [Candidatus Woesebacteria bacterium]|nr:DUF4258 domain-containing protein [Candidatus Woesebacteria bacterium]